MIFVKPDSSLSYLRMKIGNLFQKFDQYRGLNSLRADRLYLVNKHSLQHSSKLYDQQQEPTSPQRRQKVKIITPSESFVETGKSNKLVYEKSKTQLQSQIPDIEIPDDDKLKVKDCLREGNELLCQLRAKEIWLEIKLNYNIQMHSEDQFKKLSCSLEIKAMQDWSNKHLKNIIQKLAMKILNSQKSTLISSESIFKMECMRIFIRRQKHLQHRSTFGSYFEFSNVQDDSYAQQTYEQYQDLESDQEVYEVFDFNSSLRIVLDLTEITLHPLNKDSELSLKDKLAVQSHQHQDPKLALLSLKEEASYDEESKRRQSFDDTYDNQEDAKNKSRFQGIKTSLSRFVKRFRHQPSFLVPQQDLNFHDFNQNIENINKSVEFKSLKQDPNQKIKNRPRVGSVQEIKIDELGRTQFSWSGKYAKNGLYCSILVPLAKSGSSNQFVKKYSEEFQDEVSGYSEDSEESEPDEEEKKLSEKILYDNLQDDSNIENNKWTRKLNMSKIQEYALQDFILSKHELRILLLPQIRKVQFNIDHENSVDDVLLAKYGLDHSIDSHYHKWYYKIFDCFKYDFEEVKLINEYQPDFFMKETVGIKDDYDLLKFDKQFPQDIGLIEVKNKVKYQTLRNKAFNAFMMKKRKEFFRIKIILTIAWATVTFLLTLILIKS